MRGRPAGAAPLLALALACGAPPAPPAASPSPGPPAPPAPATLVAEPAGFDFGRVLPDRGVQKEFRLRNLGASELAIESVTTDCGCMVVGDYARRLPAGGSTALTVLLQTPPQPGVVVRTLVVRTAGPQPASLQLRLRATVVSGS